MTGPKFCPQCGAALLPDSSDDICPRCAFHIAMESGGHGGVDPTIQGGGPAGWKFAPPKPEQLAQHFPQLEILDLIGQGGMGAVYKARQKGLDRIVAVKILPPDSAHDPTFAERFNREARALAKLNHPNIVAVYDSGQAGDLYFFIMEYVDGVNLRQAIQAGTLSAKEALAIVPQVCDALQYAHDEGIVHRDIKPENVLIDVKGQRVKIADFGLARLMRKNADNFTLTGEQQVMGTPRYMAPEQLEGTHDVDHRADIYSLGVIFYEMLTGELPLGRFAAPSKKVQIDVRLDEVVLRTLEKEPNLRYQQAGDVKTAVQTIVGPASMPLHIQRMYGREYRSKLQIFGLPLVHIASGINPVTNERRIAKGIIAIGDQAIGVLAIGGAAFGLFAVGGLAVGGFTLGGFSLGLLLAIGGGAVGCGVALGGLAVAPIAVGGCAVGIYAAGGAGFGGHAIAGNGRDPIAQAFFRDLTQYLLGVVPILGIAVSILAILAALLAVLLGFAKAIAAVFQGAQQGTDLRSDIAGSRRTLGEQIAIGCIVLIVLGLAGLVPLGLLALTYFKFSAQQAAGEIPAATVTKAKPETASWLTDRSRQGNLNWTDDGPSVSNRLLEQLSLDANRRDQTNRVLREIHHEYLAVERKHSQREIINGRQLTRIRIPDEELTKLEQKLWTQLDGILNPAEQEAVRRLIPVKTTHRSELVPGDSATDLVFPGILGWGTEQTITDILRQGDWYDWKISSQGFSQNGNGRGLDPRWKRFWVDPSDSATAPSSEGAETKSSQ